MTDPHDAVRLARLEERLNAMVERERARAVTDTETTRIAEKTLDAHLGRLNNAEARADAVAKTVVGREVFDARMAEVRKELDGLNVRMAAWGGGVSVLAWILNYFLFRK